MSDFVYLASGSPRRRELLTQIGVNYRVHKVDVDETPRLDETADQLVRRLAQDKAYAAWHDLQCREPVLGADTVVVIDGQVLSKPADVEQAQQMLLRLSARTHHVLSGVAVVRAGTAQVSVSRSEVRFRAISANEVTAYCASGEPLDKAGAYAIQGAGAVFVQHLQGSYSGVMGLPLCETHQMLIKAGLLR